MKQQEQIQRSTIDFPRRLWLEVKAEAARQGSTFRSIVIHALGAWVAAGFPSAQRGHACELDGEEVHLVATWGPVLEVRAGGEVIGLLADNGQTWVDAESEAADLLRSKSC